MFDDTQKCEVPGCNETRSQASRLPAPVSQPVEAAQVESGDGLAPLLAEWEDANVQRVYSILNDELEHKSDEEHWEGYCARWIVGELIDPLNAEIKRLKGLLRQWTVARPIAEYHEDLGCALWFEYPIVEPPYVGTPNDCDWPGYHTHFVRLTNEMIPVPAAAVTGE